MQHDLDVCDDVSGKCQHTQHETTNKYLLAPVVPFPPQSSYCVARVVAWCVAVDAKRKEPQERQPKPKLEKHSFGRLSLLLCLVL